jgi:NAD(P)-dependent dehydrogenase (short-subunit alcohol dehydrogenase family)
VQPEDIMLTGQVAVVTGGGGGIGRAIAIALAQAGADVAIGDIAPARCEETAERIRETGRRALAVPIDVTDTDQVRSLIDKTEEAFGRLDILVNNAGGTGMRPFIEQSERSWRKHVDFNLISHFAATAAAVPVMIKGGRGGSIINVTSIEASRAAPNFTRTLSVELSDHRIRVNGIAPDFTDTPGLRGNDPQAPEDPSSWTPRTPEQEDDVARRIPWGRAGRSEECGSAAVFLASKMSEYINGVTLPVDGGAWASGGWVRSRQGKWTLIT